MYILFFITSLLFSCSDDDSQVIDMQEDVIEFTGTWQRQFEAGPGNLHYVTYKVYQDSIRYTLEGAIGSANCNIEKDHFAKTDNRFVGHNSENDIYYVLFIKDISESNITIYKKEVSDVEEGQTTAVPTADDTDNHGWNTYTKN
ncbi:MAG: hypothetical protein ACK5M1_02315 [Xanthomarina gelatinilytica]|uniref:hypothetical protein n=1 Tax=Xanthomarina gelatinilytica TaxID=1137281 RepID=UPI003A884F84